MKDVSNSQIAAEQGSQSQESYKAELHVTIFICLILFPLISVILVGGYGFLIWITQMIFGPPGA